MIYSTRMLNAMTLAMKEYGAEFVKIEETNIFFSIPKESKLNNKDKLNKLVFSFKDLLGLNLIIEIIN